MATLKASIALYDGVTAPLKNMTKAMNIVRNSFEAMQSASGNAVDVSSINAARESLARAETEFDAIAKSIEDANNQQKKFNDSIGQGENSVGSLLDKVKGVAAAIGAGAAIKKLVDMSDEMSSTNARLSLLVDDGGSVAELEDKVMASAMRSRAAYSDVAASVAKLGANAGATFDNSADQIIAFSELVNKQFIISGASATEASNAMLQLTQAMASGVLRGDELNSIFEQSPQLIQKIADYMDIPIGQVRALASEGQITADIVKNAMFAAADDINEKFNEMPMTWGQVFTLLSNVALTALQPILNGISWLANNISIIGPLVLGLAGAFTVFMIAANWAKIAAAATAAWTSVQAAFNAVMAANPIFLIVMGVMLLIGVIYAAVAAYNKFTKSTISATGLITAAIFAAGAAIGNILVSIWNTGVYVFTSLHNIVADFINFFGNVFNDPVGAIVRLIAGMADDILNILQGLASAIDTIFGSNLANAVSGWRDSLSGKVAAKFGTGVEYVAKLDATALTHDRFSYSDALKSGYNFGQNIGNAVSDAFSIGDITGSMDTNTLGKLDDLTNALNNSDLADTSGSTAGSSADTASNTSDISKDLDITNEDLKYLRDIAEREVVNRYTTASITVNMTNHNNVSSDMDLDGMTEYLRASIEEQMSAAAEGVH